MIRIVPLALLLTLLLCGCGKRAADEEDAKLGEATAGSVLVQIAVPTRQPLAATLALYGEVVHDVGTSENVSFARPVLISKQLVSTGQPVRRGQALLEVITDPNAAAAYLQAKSAVDATQREFKAQQQLADERLTTQAQLAAARKSLTDAEAALNAQRLLGAEPGVQIVRATRDGVVVNLSTQQGDRVQAGASVLQLSPAAGKRALLGAKPEDVSGLIAGMTVKLSPVFGGEPVNAVIEQVFGVINPQTRLVDVAVRISDTSRSLIQGTKVRGEVTLSAIDGWSLPRSAVLEDADGAYLFQVSGGRAKRVKVRVQMESGELASLQGEIDPNLPVVVVGNYELSDGARVRIPESTRSQE